jgi:hypothetical protein
MSPWGNIACLMISIIYGNLGRAIALCLAVILIIGLVKRAKRNAAEPYRRKENLSLGWTVFLLATLAVCTLIHPFARDIAEILPFFILVIILVIGAERITLRSLSIAFTLIFMGWFLLFHAIRPYSSPELIAAATGTAVDYDTYHNDRWFESFSGKFVQESSHGRGKPVRWKEGDITMIPVFRPVVLHVDYAYHLRIEASSSSGDQFGDSYIMIEDSSSSRDQYVTFSIDTDPSADTGVTTLSSTSRWRGSHKYNSTAELTFTAIRQGVYPINIYVTNNHGETVSSLLTVIVVPGDLHFRILRCIADTMHGKDGHLILLTMGMFAAMLVIAGGILRRWNDSSQPCNYRERLMLIGTFFLILADIFILPLPFTLQVLMAMYFTALFVRPTKNFPLFAYSMLFLLAFMFIGLPWLYIFSGLNICSDGSDVH